MGENKEFRRGITNDNKIMYKFNDRSLARYRYKQNQNPSTRLDLYDLVSHQTLSVIYFPQDGLCEAPGSDVPVKF